MKNLFEVTSLKWRLYNLKWKTKYLSDQQVKRPITRSLAFYI